MAKVLFVVDDEKIIADSLSAILRNSGFEASAFYDARSALSAGDITPPDYLISDVAMPGMHGVDLAIRIKARFPSCKILLFSGHAHTMDLLVDARNNGHDFEMLSKPLHPKELLAKLGMDGSIAPRNTQFAVAV